MSRKSPVGVAARLALLLVSLAAAWPAAAARAQAGGGVPELRQKAAELLKAQRYTEALPILEKLAEAEPDDAQTRFYLGFALIAQANNTKDAAARKALRLRAREAFLKSKALGNTEPIVDALI